MYFLHLSGWNSSREANYCLLTKSKSARPTCSVGNPKMDLQSYIQPNLEVLTFSGIIHMHYFFIEYLYARVFLDPKENKRVLFVT